ncbi:MAG: AIPR family protein [Pyrinomonadaceae bacterium]|nr:AIPR family protein [Pyrinomonadaceae bacterium]
MSRLDQKISDFVEKHFPDLDYETLLGGNAGSDEQRRALNYEYFVNAIEVYNIKRSIDPEDAKRLSTGNTQGIDSVYLLLNGAFFYIPDKDETSDYIEWTTDFDDFCKEHALIEATFVFVQSKSKATNLGNFNVFCNAVYDIFNESENPLKGNPKIQTLLDCYSKISAIKGSKINLDLKFCAINKDLRQMNELKVNWEKEIKKQKEELKSTKFDGVEILFRSGQDYEKKLDAYNSPNKRKYEVGKITQRFIEYEDNNTVCYLGLLTLKDIIALLKNDDDNLDSNVFFDNIRYYEGSTPINSRIEKSLNSSANIFHALHNGIIITASQKHYNKESGNLEIEAFSVVNGCQTCNIIWNWYEKNSKTEEDLEKYKIPAKIIITENSELRSQITEAANSQNVIKSIQLISISDNAKMLQKQFADLRLDKRQEQLIYERLSNQYPDERDYLKVTTEIVFRAFYSSFGKEPHQVARSYGKYLELKLKEIDFLGDDRNQIPKYDVDTYLLSSLAFNYLLRFLLSQYKSIYSLRHHLLLLIFISLDKDFYESPIPKKLNEDFSESVIKTVDDKKEFEELCSKIFRIVISKMDFIVDNSNKAKPKVIPKSYYTEENTKKMIEVFKSEFYPNDASAKTNS